MAFAPSHPLFLGGFMFGSIAAVVVLVAACSSDATPSTPATGDAGGSTPSATCAAPGKITDGPTDTHCKEKTQAVSAASCHRTAEAGAQGDDDDEACEYGETQFGSSGVDDDCKYKVSFTTDPICEGAAGVQFTVTIKNAVDGTPVSIDEGLDIESFTPVDTAATCDNLGSHQGPTTANLPETTKGSGVYKGPIVFDAPGQWTVRFHIHEECADAVEDSPHGHIAFRITAP